MTSDQNQSPFGDLPGALVEEMLNQSEQIGADLYNSYSAIKQNKEFIKTQLTDKGKIIHESEFASSNIPTTCGIDGARVVERLLSMDFAACAAVGVEGLTPPSETKHWDGPKHTVLITPLLHNSANPLVISGKMLSMEVILSSKAPHDIVFSDGSFTTPLIHVNAAVNGAIRSHDEKLREIIHSDLESFLISYKTVLESIRTDKIFASLPKYTTKRELGEEFGWPPQYDDRAVLTTILRPGELIKPTPLQQEDPDSWHLKTDDNDLDCLVDDVLSAIKKIQVFYYRPNPWTPVLRIEISESISKNPARLGTLIQGIKFQCGAPGIIEPYPLFIADRMVKHLSTGLSAIRQCSTRQMVELDNDPDLSDIFFIMHGYRT